MKKKLIGTILTLLCTGVVAFSGWQVYKIMSETLWTRTKKADRETGAADNK